MTAKPRSGYAAGVDYNVCGQCGAAVPASYMQMHSDWHCSQEGERDISDTPSITFIGTEDERRAYDLGRAEGFKEGEKVSAQRITADLETIGNDYLSRPATLADRHVGRALRAMAHHIRRGSLARRAEQVRKEATDA